MEKKAPEFTFQLLRLEDLNPQERSQVQGLTEGMDNGLVVKEYSSNSFVKLRKFVAKDNSFISQLKEGWTNDDRKSFSEQVGVFLK